MSSDLLLPALELGIGVCCIGLGYVAGNRKARALLTIVKDSAVLGKVCAISKADGTISDAEAHEIATGTLQLFDDIEQAGFTLVRRA